MRATHFDPLIKAVNKTLAKRQTLKVTNPAAAVEPIADHHNVVETQGTADSTKRSTVSAPVGVVAVTASANSSSQADTTPAASPVEIDPQPAPTAAHSNQALRANRQGAPDEGATAKTSHTLGAGEREISETNSEIEAAPIEPVPQSQDEQSLNAIQAVEAERPEREEITPARSVKARPETAGDRHSQDDEQPSSAEPEVGQIHQPSNTGDDADHDSEQPPQLDQAPLSDVRPTETEFLDTNSGATGDAFQKLLGAHNISQTPSPKRTDPDDRLKVKAPPPSSSETEPNVTSAPDDDDTVGDNANESQQSLRSWFSPRKDPNPPAAPKEDPTQTDNDAS